MCTYRPGRPTKYRPATGDGIKPPAKAGEYRIRNSDGVIVYIGETNDLARRMSEHIRSGKLSVGENAGTFEFQVADGRSTSRTRREHEREKIVKHHPELNKSKGGEGRPAGK